MCLIPRLTSYVQSIRISNQNDPWWNNIRSGWWNPSRWRFPTMGLPPIILFAVIFPLGKRPNQHVQSPNDNPNHPFWDVIWYILSFPWYMKLYLVVPIHIRLSNGDTQMVLSKMLVPNYHILSSNFGYHFGKPEWWRGNRIARRLSTKSRSWRSDHWVALWTVQFFSICRTWINFLSVSQC